MELVVEKDSKIVGKTLKEISFPQGSILGAIVREGAMQIPTGNTYINPGESVIVFALPNAIEKIQALFSGKKD